MRPVFNSPLLSIAQKKDLFAKTEELRRLQRQTAENIVRMGQILIDVKAMLPSGQFEDYLHLEFGQDHGYTPRSAQNFMNVARQFGDKPVTYSIAPSVLYLLAAPSTPDKARQQAIDLVESGEKISVDRAKAMVAEAKVEPEAEYRDCEVVDPDLFDYKPPGAESPPLDPPALPIEVEPRSSTLPDNVWQALREICSEFDLCCNAGDAPTVPCVDWEPWDAGLRDPWRGSIFIDLVGCRSPEQWVDKLGEPSQVRLAIVRANLSHQTWFHILGYSAGAVCFLANQPQALFYIGPSYSRFVEQFRYLGFVARGE